MLVDAHLEQELQALDDAGLLRRPLAISGRGPRVHAAGHPLVAFSSNDYLGLASHPRLHELARAAYDDEPEVGSTASRLITGTKPAHLAAERRLAALVHRPAALLFSTGYAANVGALPALMDARDVVFSDALNHASLIDGIRLSGARKHVIEHRDLEAFRDALLRHRGDARRAWVVTEAIFSMDGDLAPLADLRALCDSFEAGLYVDEAHSLGVVSAQGACHDAGVVPDVLVGTLGKAFGLAGAFVAGSDTLRTILENRARSYVYSTAPPASHARAIITAADLVEDADERRATLRGHALRLREGLTAQGWTLSPDGYGPILPVLVGEPERAMTLAARLFDTGYLVRGIRPPTVPPGTSRLRIVPSALHTHEDVEGLIHAMTTLRADPHLEP